MEAIYGSGLVNTTSGKKLTLLGGTALIAFLALVLCYAWLRYVRLPEDWGYESVTMAANGEDLKVIWAVELWSGGSATVSHRVSIGSRMVVRTNDEVLWLRSGRTVRLFNTDRKVSGGRIPYGIGKIEEGGNRMSLTVFKLRTTVVLTALRRF